MILKTTIVGMGLTSGAGAASLLLGFSNYIPYVVGGCVLYFYLATHRLLEQSVKTFFLIVLGSVVVGWLSSGVVGFAANVFEHLAVTYFSEMEGIQEKAQSIKSSVVKLISFGLGGLSYNIYKSFFGNRDKILKIALKKAESKVINND